MRYALAIITKDQTTKTVAKILYERFIVMFGRPGKLLSYQGANFTSVLVTKLCAMFGIQKCQTTAITPSFKFVTSGRELTKNPQKSQNFSIFSSQKKPPLDLFVTQDLDMAKSEQNNVNYQSFQKLHSVSEKQKVHNLKEVFFIPSYNLHPIVHFKTITIRLASSRTI